jgi:hypothetical protein
VKALHLRNWFVTLRELQVLRLVSMFAALFVMATPGILLSQDAAVSGKWTGRTTTSSDGPLLGGAAPVPKGTAEITMTPTSDTSYTRIRIEYRGGRSTRSDASIAWALLQGRCGSGALPVVPMDAFPLLNISGSGSASATAEINFAFPRDGNYHVNLYRGDRPTSQQVMGLTAVIGCGNLKYKK